MRYLSTSNKMAVACAVLASVSVDVVAQDAAFTATGVVDKQLPVAIDATTESKFDELQHDVELYGSAIEIGNYTEADFLAKHIVELSIQRYGLDSHEVAIALANLGQAQQKNADYVAAILNFQAAIDIVERIENRLHLALVRPLRGLAAAQLGSDRPKLARQAFKRAVHVSRVNEGPHNNAQIDILEELAEVELAIGNKDKASHIHEYLYNLEARNNDQNSEAMIPGLERHAAWLHRMDNVKEERAAWRKIINIIDDKRGKKDLSLIGPLTEVANSYLYEPAFHARNYINDGSREAGETYLKRAMRIAEQNSDADWRIRLQTKLALADFYTLRLHEIWAGRMYRELWHVLSSGDEQLATRRTLFDQPALLQPIHPPKYLNSLRWDDGQDSTDDYVLGTIVVSYNISKRGFAKDIKIADADPPGLQDMEFSVARNVRRLIHRPRMENGVAMATPNQTYVHEFYYRPSEVLQASN